MRVTATATTLRLRHRPVGPWLLSGTYVMVGLLIVPLVLVADDGPGPLARWLTVALGVCAVAFGSSRLTRMAASEVVLDQSSRTLILHESTLLGTRTRSWPLAAVSRLELDRTADHRNRPQFRLLLHLHDSQTLPLTAWQYDEVGVTAALGRAGEFLRRATP